MTITKEMTIATVLQLVPNADIIMFEYGLHCIGCHGSLYESIVAGASMHGMSLEKIEEMVSKINEHYKQYQENVKENKFSLTDSAYGAIKAKTENECQGGGLKIEIEQGMMGHNIYRAEVTKEKPKDYQEIDYKDTKLFVDKKDLEKFWETEIDYIADDFREGFAISKPIPVQKED